MPLHQYAFLLLRPLSSSNVRLEVVQPPVSALFTPPPVHLGRDERPLAVAVLVHQPPQLVVFLHRPLLGAALVRLEAAGAVRGAQPGARALGAGRRRLFIGRGTFRVGGFGSGFFFDGFFGSRFLSARARLGLGLAPLAAGEEPLEVLLGCCLCGGVVGVRGVKRRSVFGARMGV